MREFGTDILLLFTDFPAQSTALQD